MKFLYLAFLYSLTICGITALITTAGKSSQLTYYDTVRKVFKLNENALIKLSRLEGIIRVVSAVGEARIGKSTTLNVVLHKWKATENSKGNIEETFETGDALVSRSRGIWMSINQNSKRDNIVLLDVVGVGSDAVTDKLNILTALMSSEIIVFCSDTAIKASILDFLYRLASRDHINNIGHLHFVIRADPLISPKAGWSLEDHVKDFLTKPSRDEEGDEEKRKLLAKHFQREDITVSEMPYIQDSRQSFFRSSSEVRNHVKYWNAIQVIAQRLESFAVKKTILGGFIDGSVFVKQAKSVVETINTDAWVEFGETYLSTAKTFCDISYDDVIAPVMALETSTDVQNKMESAIGAFKDRCALPEQVIKAQDGLRQLIERHKAAEHRIKEAALKRTREAEQRLEEAKEMLKEAERKTKELEEKKRETERAIKEAEKMRRNADEEVFHIREFKRKSRRRNRRFKITNGLSLGVVIRGILSDTRLKRIVTTLRPSKYEVLGLREVAWVWNEHAQRLGLSGTAHGIVAQEVEQFYPWAVLTGHDGYKRVNYAALDIVVTSSIARIAKRSYLSDNFLTGAGEVHERGSVAVFNPVNVRTAYLCLAQFHSNPSRHCYNKQFYSRARPVAGAVAQCGGWLKYGSRFT